MNQKKKLNENDIMKNINEIIYFNEKRDAL